LATSQDPGTLGVYGFRNRRDHSYDGLEIVTSQSIRAPAIGDHIAEQTGGRACIIGVPPNYPPRAVNGYSVGCFLTPSTATGPLQSSHLAPRDDSLTRSVRATLPGVFTNPPELGEEITRRFGPYTVDVPNFRTADKARLRDDIFAISRQQFAVARHLLRADDWAYFQFVDIGLDRVQHGFWRHHDPRHRLHVADSPFRDVVREYYRHLDDEVGRLLDLLDENTIVLVVSDHGAVSLDGGFCVNQWLIEQGWLALHRCPQEKTPFARLDVDWSRTRVWSEGGYYARIFLNVAGREPQGTIPPGDYDRVRDEVQQRLEDLTDDQGRPMGNLVFRPEEIYRQVNGVAPDLLVHFGGLRWRSIGSVGHPSVYVQENDTGPDDCNHAQHGAFILAGGGTRVGRISNPADNSSRHSDGLENRPTRTDGAAHLLDMAPTLLDLGGYDVPRKMQGRSLGDAVVADKARTTFATGALPRRKRLG
jgi:predicted AlkP superfamily phosphohydrolase/phosphomutase